METRHGPPPYRTLCRRRLARGLAALLLIGMLQTGCDRSIYVRDGVTDGDAFYILPQTLQDPDPVNQSWIAYSLGRSSCELEIGGPTPSRNSAFSCELFAREMLLDTWDSYKILQDSADEYLDELTLVREQGFLDEYVWHYFHRRQWKAPGELEPERFADWRRRRLRGHRARTQLSGAWIRKRR